MDRSHSVDGLVAAHLAHHGEDRIDLRAFRYMLEEGRIVLLFDGFDELVTRLSYDRAADHLENLLEAARGKAKVVVAARTQHFRTDEQVFTALGRQVGVDPAPAGPRGRGLHRGADPRLLRQPARRRRGGRRRPLPAARGHQRPAGARPEPPDARLRGRPGHGAGARPPSRTGTRSARPGCTRRSSTPGWPTRADGRRAARAPRPASTPRRCGGAVTTLAMALWEADETWLRPAQLVEVADTLTGLTAETLSQQQRVHAVGSGSLLVRTEEGLFGFIHPSVTEWLVAKAIAAEFNAGIAAPAALVRQPLRQQAVDFLCDIADTRAVRAWADAGLARANGSGPLAANARAVRARLDAPATLGHAGRLAARRRPVLPRPGGSRPHRRRPHQREPRGGEPDRRRAARRRAGRRPAGPGPARQQRPVGRRPHPRPPASHRPDRRGRHRQPLDARSADRRARRARRTGAGERGRRARQPGRHRARPRHHRRPARLPRRAGSTPPGPGLRARRRHAGDRRRRRRRAACAAP